MWNDLDDVSNDQNQNFELLKMEAGNPGGMGAILGFSLTNMLKRTKPFGISSHLHYCWQYLGKAILKTNDHATIGAWTALGGGSGINVLADAASKANAIPAIKLKGGTSFEMPQIAQSWDELTRLLESAGARAEGSVAGHMSPGGRESYLNISSRNTASKAGLAIQKMSAPRCPTFNLCS